MTTEVRIVLCNAPDVETAEAIAKRMIDRRLASCVNILPPCRSLYWWDGEVEETSEIPMVFKTTTSACDALCRAIADMHPYEVPEILSLDVASGLESYCRWVRRMVHVE